MLTKLVQRANRVQKHARDLAIGDGLTAPSGAMPSSIRSLCLSLSCNWLKQ